MGHVSANKDNLIKRVKRIAGQIQAVEKALDAQEHDDHAPGEEQGEGHRGLADAAHVALHLEADHVDARQLAHLAPEAALGPVALDEFARGLLRRAVLHDIDQRQSRLTFGQIVSDVKNEL